MAAALDLVLPGKNYFTLFRTSFAEETTIFAEYAIIFNDMLFQPRYDFMYSFAENAVLNIDEISHAPTKRVAVLLEFFYLQNYLPNVNIVSPMAWQFLAETFLQFRKSTVLHIVLNVFELHSRVSSSLQYFCLLVKLAVQICDVEQRKTPNLVKPLVGKA